jgi:ubiquinone/menaquinone biosynthesis C-methylase UbiE
VRYREDQERKYEALLQLAFSDLSRAVGHRIDVDGALASTVVDSGCGTAMLLEFLLARLGTAPGRYVGLDISFGMLREGRNKGHGCFVQATAELAPLRPAVADCVASVSTFQNLDEDQQHAYLHEIDRLCKPSTKLFLFSFLNKPPLSDRVDEILAGLECYYDHVVLAPERRDIEDRLIACSG